ncbi:MAG: MFS transporter [Aquiluna sp.]|nr:MFS transporter [Aquiluna sp.]
MKPSSRLTARLGISQFIGWSSGFYLPAILAVPISESLGIATETFFWAFTVALLVAAFLGPRVGKAIDRLGGRRVLPFGSIAFILGLSTLAASTSVQMLFAAWVLIGIGAAMGNYDAAFATVVTFFGDESNKIIAGITVFVGLSSTISWPLNAWVTENFSWQWAVMVWAFAHLLIALPLNLTIPRLGPRPVAEPAPATSTSYKRRIRIDLLIVIFAVMFALEGFMVASVNTILPFLLTELGASMGVALFAAAILGPSQVLARVLLVVLGRVMTPMRVAALAMLSHPLGVALVVVFGVDALVPFVVLQGIAVGLDPFIRGTLPLLFFGPEQFGERQGYIMMFSKIVVAFSPLLLTVIVLRNPIAGIVTTMSMGITAFLLLMGLALLRSRRELVLAGSNTGQS